MRLCRIVVAALVVVAVAAPVAAQSGTPVTVETHEGELVDGVLVSATETEVVIRIAGQPLTLAVDSLRYISFDGRIEASADVVDDRNLVEALGALQGLITQLTGLEEEDRDFFAGFLGSTLPIVQRFLNSPDDDWASVKHAMGQAVWRYRETLNDDPWDPDHYSVGAAAAYVTYAERLGRDPNERRHTEDGDETRVVVIGEPAEGRLGAGDRLMARSLDSSSTGAYNDLFQLTLAAPVRTDIVLRCTPCSPHLTLTDATGAKIEGDAGSRGGRSRIRRDLEAGTYYVWAGTNGPNDVGEYTLEVAPRK